METEREREREREREKERKKGLLLLEEEEEEEDVIAFSRGEKKKNIATKREGKRTTLLCGRNFVL